MPRQQRDLDEIRDFTRATVDAVGVHVAARGIGISSGSLRQFLGGRVPYAKTRERIMEWGFNSVRFRSLATSSLRSLTESPRR